MDGILWFLVILVIIAVALGLYAVSLYNGFQRDRNLIQESWRQIDVELNRRYDLIPRLVETVRAYAAHERNTLEGVTRMRNQAASLAQHGGTAAQRAQAEEQLSEAVRNLIVSVEAYPHPFVTLQRPGQGLVFQYPQRHGGRHRALSENLQTRGAAVNDRLELGVVVVLLDLGLQTDFGTRLDVRVLAGEVFVVEVDEDAIRRLGIVIPLQILQVETLVEALTKCRDHRLDRDALGAFELAIGDEGTLATNALNDGDGGEGTVSRAAEAGGMDGRGRERKPHGQRQQGTCSFHNGSFFIFCQCFHSLGTLTKGAHCHISGSSYQ